MSYQKSSTIEGLPHDALGRLSSALESRGYHVESASPDTIVMSSDIRHFGDPLLNSSELTIRIYGQTIELTANLSNVDQMRVRSNRSLIRIILLLPSLLLIPCIGICVLDYPNGLQMLGKAASMISRDLRAKVAFIGVPIVVLVGMLGIWFHLRTSYEPNGIRQLDEMVELAAKNSNA